MVLLFFSVANIDLSTASATLSGDFSFGVWSFDGTTWSQNKDGVLTFVNGNSTGDKINDDGSVTISQPSGTGNLPLVVENAATLDIIQKGDYNVDLEGVKFKVSGAGLPSDAEKESFSGLIGSITYNTKSVEIPYVTTYSDYNQRIYLTNNGGQDANYVTTFISEDGVTATGGDKAIGVIPAGEMITIKAKELVTIVGGTRTNATIEIEGQNIDAVSQTVNKSDGSTDTLVIEVR